MPPALSPYPDLLLVQAMRMLYDMCHASMLTSSSARECMWRACLHCQLWKQQHCQQLACYILTPWSLIACRISYLAYIKVFVGLARDRLNGLLASPSANSVAHMRALGLLAWIVTDNATWVLLHFAAFPASDMTYRLLWLFDPVVITLEALLTASTYGKVTWECSLLSCRGHSSVHSRCLATFWASHAVPSSF